MRIIRFARTHLLDLLVAHIIMYSAGLRFVGGHARFLLHNQAVSLTATVVMIELAAVVVACMFILANLAGKKCGARLRRVGS